VPEQDPASVVQDPEPAASGAAPASAPPEPSAGSSPAAADPNRERNRLAQEGRQRAALERNNQALQTQLATQQQELQLLRQQVGGVVGLLTSQQQVEQEARMAALPPGQRTQVELDLVKQELLQTRQLLTQQAQAQEQQRQEQLQREAAVVYKTRRMAELVDDANEQYGLEGDLAIRGDEEELDDAGEVTYKASLRTLALTRRKNGQSQGSGGDGPVATKSSEETPEKMRERIKQEVLQELGVQRPNSPRAAAGADSPERIDDDLQDTLRSYDNRRPGLLRQQLRELNERAGGVNPPPGRRGR
jgi:hypothetical protein